MTEKQFMDPKNIHQWAQIKLRMLVVELLLRIAHDALQENKRGPQ